MGIKCPKCQFDNPSDSKFCKECGTQIISSEEISPTKTLETPTDKLSSGITFAGRYEIIEELGKGGMGRVYRVKDQTLDEEMALKVLKPEIAADKGMIERFKNELKLARKIAHKSICKMYDLNEEEDYPYITMEYVKGEDLKSYIRRKAKLSEKETIAIAKQVCEGLAEAHEIGVVHRDLKPQNIMIDKKGNAKVMDFGIARSVEAGGVTQTGVMIGTPDYISPEQAEGKEADQRSDIYALGIVLYEMLTGQVPFTGDTALSVAVKHMKEEPQDPRELNDRISEDLSSVILKCLEKGQEARFQNVAELLLEFRNIEQGLPLTTGVERHRVPAFLVDGAEEVEAERPVFVAREEELSKLEGFLEIALSGKGRIVFVKGEAGSGKTALIQEFARRAQEALSDLITASGSCNAHTGIGDPYLPFREVLALLAGDVEGRWKAGSVSRDHAQRLWHCLPILARSLVDSGPELIDTFVAGGELLARARSYVGRDSGWLRNLKELVERKAATPADPMLQQSVLLEQFARVLEALAGQKPVLLLLDDLQWADAGSTSLLMHLVDRIQDTRMLIVGAYRPEEVALDRAGERHPLKPVINQCKAKFGDIEVSVGKEGSREFVDAILNTEPNRFSNAFREAFHRHTQGHSLFTIEVFRSLKEQGTLVRDAGGLWTETEVDWERLPTRVEAMIGERIDRMPENLREVLKVASIEGEYFIGEVLAEVCEGDEKEMMRCLSGELDKQYQLVRAQGIRRIDGQRLSQYRFRHILFQKYLYSTLDEVERAHLHEDVGNVLERRYGENAEVIAAQLARHFQEAGIAEKAIKYLQQAGAEAVRSSANEEAVSYFGKALELLKKSPATPERIGQELALQAALAVALQSLRGYADPGLGEAFSRIYDLCKQVGETPKIARALYGLWAFHVARAQLEPGISLAEQILRLAPKAEDPTVVSLYGHTAQAFNLNTIGEFDRALEYSEKTVCIYEPLKHGPLVFQVGADFKGVALAYSSFALWFLGYPDRGKQKVRDAIAHSREMAHPYTHSYALFYDITFHQLCRDVQAVQEAVTEELKLSTEYGFQGWVGLIKVYQGWVLAEQGRPAEGIALIREGMAFNRAVGLRIFKPTFLEILADACVKAGQTEEGLATLAEALTLVEETEQRYYEAELHRRQGELLLLRGDNEDEVELHYQRAIDIARRQNAKSWELRATMSLARLWQKQGKKKEAQKILNEIYDWFTEGFDTQDLKDAKALLEEMS